MTTDEFVYYLILKNEIEAFQSKLQERIKNKQDSINEKLKQYALPSTLENLKIVQAQLGNDAGILGAAYLGMM